MAMFGGEVSGVKHEGRKQFKATLLERSTGTIFRCHSRQAVYVLITTNNAVICYVTFCWLCYLHRLSAVETTRLCGVCHVLKFMLNQGAEIWESTKKSANKQRAFAL